MTKLTCGFIDEKQLKHIARKYNPLDYTEQLTQLLNYIYPGVSFNGSNKFQLHQAINDVVIKLYNGEQGLKYQLFQAFYKKKVVGAFEIKVNNSRADFLTING